MHPWFSQLVLNSATIHGAVVLMYHSVIDPAADKHGGKWSITRTRFKEQIRWLRDHGWHCARISELPQFTITNVRKVFAITFDDGYADNLAAVDELVALGMVATWYIVSQGIEDPGRTALWDGGGARKLLTGTQLREMHEVGMEVGSHTVTHRRLTEVNSQEVSSELVNSRKAIEDCIGARVTSFAYPYGVFDGYVERAVAAAGYLTACTTHTGWAMRDRNPLAIRRVTIYNSDQLGHFLRKIAFADNEVRWRRVANSALTRVAGSLGWRNCGIGE